MGGSILPVTIHDNKIYFLFGKERDIDDTPGWSDFGGGTDKGETFLETACREGGEELTGFLGSNKEIKKMLNKYGTHIIDYKSQGYTNYRCHIFPLKYDEMLPKYYNNNQTFIQKHLDPMVINDTKIFEKTQIKWFSFDDIKKNKKQFRSFYQNIIDIILKDKANIEQFVKRGIKNKKTKKNKKTNKNKKINKTKGTNKNKKINKTKGTRKYK